MSVTFQLQTPTPVGFFQVPPQRLRHQRAFCCRIDQDRESQTPSYHGAASSSGAFLSGSAPRARLCASMQRRTDRQALTTCQATTDKQTIAVTGATGLVGSRLVSKLTAQGNTVRVLTRNPSAASNKLPYPRVEYYGPSQWASAVQGSDAVINLAGEPISSRWTPAIKTEIKQSRVGVTRQIVEAINAAPEDRRPQVFISTSAIGFYGTSESQTFSEASSSGGDYLAEVCRDWEAEAQKAKSQRTVIFRTGIVLAREGGALGKMLPVFNIFAGGPLGSGRQWCSWIHRDDLVNMYIQALKDKSFSGVYNATAPNPVRMSELCSSLGGQLGRPSWLPVPDFALQAILGEGATIVLEGQRVIPKRAQEQGFDFTFDNINAAMKDVVRA